MNRPLRLLSLLILLLLIVRGSEELLEAILDNELPPLLTEELGLPVRIAPLRTDIISLTASTARLEMGEPGELSVDARNVRVSLNWSDLLRGEIRLVDGDGSELTLDISAWPKGDGPPAEDYANLEQWLPGMLDLDLVRYRREDRSEIELHQARWRRAGKDKNNASLAWQSRFPTGSLDIDIDVASLGDFLWLRRFDANITLATDLQDLPVSELKLAIKPAATQAYDLALQGTLAGLPLELHASGAEPWSLPHRSRTRAESVDAGTLIDLARLFLADGEEDAYEGELTASLPPLDLLRHDASIDIGELHLGKEMIHDVGLSIVSSGNFLAITEIKARGLYGDLVGSAAAASVGDEWEAALAADLQARAADNGLMTRYVNSAWFARQGNVRLRSRGSTWAELLDDLQGAIELTGTYRGAEEMPVALTARLDGSPERFALEQLDLQLGDATLTGELEYSGADERYIKFSARGDTLDVNFLTDEESEVSKPGVALPTFLTALPGYRLIADLRLDTLILPGSTLKQFEAQLDRGVQEGTMSVKATGPSNGTLAGDLVYTRAGQQETEATLELKLDRVHINEFLGLGRGALDSRTSGSVELKSRGGTVREMFARGRGAARLKLEIHEDRDWSRPSEEHEIVNFGGEASLVLEQNSIVGVVIEAIDIGSLNQELNGNLSAVVNRDPVIVGNFDSEKIDLDRLLEWIPESPEEADEDNLLTTLRDLVPGRIRVDIDTLIWRQRPMERLSLDIRSRERGFAVEKLAFTFSDTEVDGRINLAWKEDVAQLDADASINAMRIFKVLDLQEERLRNNLADPLSGELKIQSLGQTLEELLVGLNGHLRLASPGQPDAAAEHVDIEFQRLPDGGLVKFNRVQLAGSDLRGALRSTRTEPIRYDLKLSGGVLDLQPWELAKKEPSEDERKKASAIERTADAARGLAGFAGRIFSRDQKTRPGDRIFSSEPLDVSPLFEVDLRVHGDLARLYSSAAVAEDLAFDASARDGKLEIEASAVQVNGGELNLSLDYDAAAEPHRLALELKGTGVHRRPEQSSYPSSAHVVLDSTGTSEAELAANLNGQAYFELGRGPIDYGGMAFITADAATSMFRALIPGAKQRVPELRCGVTLLQFTDGVGVTPYGYAARTRTANLLGGLELNLVDERISVRFRSQSRKGVGISIGNAFSSTVELAGPLNNPAIVPNTPGLLFRGWAAFMTGGLSVLGESVFNRVLASDNPCKSTQKEIRKSLCQTTLPLSNSPLTCPTPEAAAN